MMLSFSELIDADGAMLERILFPGGARSVAGRQEVNRERKAQQLGVRPSQLVCGIGFNAAAQGRDDVAVALGYRNFEALAADRNFRFIHDNYSDLSVNNVLDIYRVSGRDESRRKAMYDAVFSRLAEIESQLEGTINPILVGGYKLEITNIYQNHLASQDLLNSRLQRHYAVLRDISGELAVMLESGTLSAHEMLRESGVTASEKARLVFQGLIAPELVTGYLNDAEVPRADREALANIALRKAGT